MLPDSNVQWQAYPALWLAGCFAAGIAGAQALPGLTFWHWVGLAVPGCLPALYARRLARRRLVSASPLLDTVAALLVVAATGGAWFTSRQALPARHLAHLLYGRPGLDAPVLLAGRVLDTPVDRPSGTRFLLAGDTLYAAQDTLRATGRVQVTLARSAWKPAAAFPPVARGDLVRLYGRLRAPPRRRNPADFDYGAYLRRHGVYATLTVYDAANVAVTGSTRTWAARVVAPAQAYARRQLERLVPDAGARAVLLALVLGDRTSLDDETRHRFARTGLTHLLAVSGLHVLLVGMILYGLLRPILMRMRCRWKVMEIVRAAATMALLVFYMLLTGASASVVRAVVMAGLFIGGAVLQRSAHSLNTLGVAALVLLLARPDHLFEAGFQLSFAAVAALVTLHPRLRERVPETWSTRPVLRGAVALVTTSLAATLGTMPVLLYHFGQASFAGLLLNLLAIPLTALALASGLAALALGGWLAPGAEVFGAAADALAQGLLLTAHAGDDALGWAAVRWYVQDAWFLLAMAAALTMLAQWPRPRLRWRLGAAALGLATIGVWVEVAAGAHRPRLEVVYFDVGHGDAALVTLPGGRHLLVDAGGRDAFSDHAARTLVPHLERFGVRRLDAVVVSHPHNDHLGGLPTLLRSVPVGRFLHNAQSYPSDLYEETQRTLDRLAVPHRAVRAGDTLALDPSVLLQILGPDRAETADLDANDASVVVRMIYGRTAFLFAGDAEAEAERRLVDRYGALLRSDVVKVPHHGSRTSSTEPFVEHVLPDTAPTATAVVSVGSHTLFGLPDEEVVARWRSHGASVWITADRGALWLRSDGRTVRRVRWR